MTVLREKLAICFFGHRNLCDRGNRQRIGDTKKDGGDKCVKNCDDECFSHGVSSGEMHGVERQIDKLDSNEWHNDAAYAVDD